MSVECSCPTFSTGAMGFLIGLLLVACAFGGMMCYFYYEARKNNEEMNKIDKDRKKVCEDRKCCRLF